MTEELAADTRTGFDLYYRGSDQRFHVRDRRAAQQVVASIAG